MESMLERNSDTKKENSRGFLLVEMKGRFSVDVLVCLMAFLLDIGKVD